MKIVPAIIAKDIDDLRTKLRLTASFSDTVQIDFFDDRFVPGYSGPDPRRLDGLKTDLKLIAHVLAFRPLDYLAPLLRAGVSRVLFHLESEDPPDEVIDKARSLGLAVGLGINPATDAAKLSPFIADVDEVLFLAVDPSAPGVFKPAVLDKPARLPGRCGPARTVISVDGGISRDNIKAVRDAGVDVAYVGNAVYGAGRPAADFESLVAIVS